MEGNVCDFNHLEEGVLPPPRKRPLAGYKKQNCNEQLCASTTSASPPTPTTPTEIDVCVKNLMRSHSSGGSGGGSSSLEEIAESSKKAALASAEVAEAARAVAEEKAYVAAKAIAAAKSALDVVATLYEETSGGYRHAKRNRSKKQVAVHSLYKKRDEIENGKTDETEQKLRQVIHCSSMLYKHSPPSSDSKNHKHKKHMVSPVIVNPKFPREGLLEGDSHAMYNGKATLNNEGYSREVAAALENEKRSQCLTKLISSNWRVEKDIVTQKRKARKQLIHMVERQVDLN